MAADGDAERLRELEDRAAIEAVVVAYATALDTKDFEALRDLFTDDVVWEYEGLVGPLRGADAIVVMMRGSLEHLDATQHLNGNHVITVRGDEADHVGYFQAMHVRTGHPGGEQYLGAGRYRDRLRRTPKGWRLSSRVASSLWSTGNPAVLAR
jgi:uncharacterized protein (TIGR02246 family)